MVAEPGQAFLWGSGGRRLTPEEILLERKEANALGQQAMSTAPVGHWAGGVNRVLQGLLAGYDQNVASAASDKNAAEGSSLVAQALAANGGLTPAASPITAPAASAVAPVSTPMGNTSIPAGTVDPRLSEAISGAATANGVDPAYMTRLALVENGGKIDGTSPLSSASGPFQFINSTAKQYGLTNPADPAAAATAAARLTLDNKAALTQALGREPTPGELYLAHQQGAGGAAKLLANPDAPVESVIGAQAARNNGATPGMTAGQFASKWTGKFSDIGAPQVVDANQPSPLDTAQYPAGPVGAPTAVADGSDPAALPTNAAPAQGALPTAQAVQAATQPARPAINPAILKLMTSRYVSDSDRKIGAMLFKSQMDQQTKASDPMRALQIQKLQADIDKTRGKAGTTEYGLNPIYGTDEQGNPVLGTMGKDGTFKKVDTSGVKISTGVDKIDLGTQFAIYDKKSGQLIGYQPKDLRGAESEKVIGKAEGAAKSTLSSDLNNSEQTIKQLDDLIKHPGLSTIAGPIDQFRQSYMMGAEGRDALARYNQLKGKAFLQAYTTLRGGGQITEVEGTKAENAMARMDRAQSEADFKAALTDFRDAVKTGMDKMREKAGGIAPQSAPAGKTSSGVPWSIQ